MNKYKEKLFIFIWCLAIQASGILLMFGIIEKNIVTLITGILCFGLFSGLLVTYFSYTIDRLKNIHADETNKLILKYEARCKVIADHCIERYHCKFDGEDLIFPYDGDDEDNCMASGYAEEYYTLKGVIEKLKELIQVV
jgi:hypothetical protein